MGTWRRSGQVVESSAAPLIVSLNVKPNRLLASDGVTVKQIVHIGSYGGVYIAGTSQNTGADGDTFEIPIYGRGNETKLSIGMFTQDAEGMFDLYVNGNIERAWSTIDGSGKAFLDDGGVFTDDTTDAGDAGAGDCPLMPAVEAVNDAFYFGWGGKFAGIRIDIGTPGVGNTVAWEYYNGAAWVAVPGLVDGTSGLTAAAGNHDITFTPPSNWATVAVNAVTIYWIRARVTAANFTTIPVADQVWIYGGYDNYSAGNGLVNREITLQNSINPGYNMITLVLNGKNASSSGNWIITVGVSIY